MTDRTPTSSQRRRTRAGILIIGDEVLSARIQEQNLGVMLQALARAGVITQEVAVLPDDLERIASVARDFARRFDLVITTGGVGPTHDDMTWAAVAQAHDVPLVLRQDVLEMMERRNGGPLSQEQQRMAMLPEQAKVERVGRGFAIRLDDVWVLPGVPSMVHGRIDFIAQRYGAAPLWTATARFDVDEWEVVADIDALVRDHPRVQIGSYPIFDADDHRLKLTFVADEREHAAVALDDAIRRLGHGAWLDTQWSGGGA